MVVTIIHNKGKVTSADSFRRLHFVLAHLLFSRPLRSSDLRHTTVPQVVSVQGLQTWRPDVAEGEAQLFQLPQAMLLLYID